MPGTAPESFVVLSCDDGAMAEPAPLRIPQRSTDDRVVAGVCAGVAAAVGLDPMLVRIAMIVLAGEAGAANGPLLEALDTLDEETLDDQPLTNDLGDTSS